MKSRLTRSGKTIPLAAVLALLLVFGGCSRGGEKTSEVTGPETDGATVQTPEASPAYEEEAADEISTGDPERATDYPLIAGPPSDEPEAETVEPAEEDDVAAKERELALRERELDLRERELAFERREAQKREAQARKDKARQAERREADRRAAEEAAAAEKDTYADTGLGEGEDASQEPEPAPTPEPVRIEVPVGTEVGVRFLTQLASNTSQVGDLFRAKVIETVTSDGVAAIPAGSEVHGRVTEAFEPQKVGGRSRLGIEFTDLVLPSGVTLPLEASFVEEGESSGKKDAKTIGAAAAGGAILGRILGGGSKTKRSVIGAIVGAAAGTAIASRNAGEPVRIEPGAELDIRIDRELVVVLDR